MIRNFGLGTNQGTEKSEANESSCSRKACCTPRKSRLWVLALATVAALAVLIIGGLALGGVQNPHGLLASFGKAIGLKGSIAMVAASGGTLFLLQPFRWCIKEESEYEQLDEESDSAALD